MADIKISNSFNAYKADFKKDVGKDVNEETIDLYAKYVTTRSLDKNNSIMIILLNTVINMPVEIREELRGLIANRK